MKTDTNGSLKKSWIIPLVLILLLLMAMGATLTVTVLQLQGLPPVLKLANALNTAHASNGLDPNLLVEPATYDARRCATLPTANACNGLYPVAPQHVSQTLGNQNGAGACFDRNSRAVEAQPLTDQNGNGVGQLTLYWLPTCLSYTAVTTFVFPLDQVSSSAIWVQTESYGWFQQISQLPPQPIQTEETGPVSGGALTGQTLYSPLIYAPSDPVSAHIDLQLQDGTEYNVGTGSYTAGVLQYTA